MVASLTVCDQSEPTGSVRSLIRSPYLLLLLQLSAFWNVWEWIGGRFTTSGDVWALLPLLTIIGLAWFMTPKQNSRIDSLSLTFAAVFLLTYAVSFAFAPPLVRSTLAIVSITFILSSWRFERLFHFGVFALLLLSLPITESLNFFLGYPMRAVVGEAVEFLLNMQGLDVYREGVCLHFGEKLIWIDAPCSGVKMLWFGTFLAATLAVLFNVGASRLFAIFGLTFAAILFGNILRASALFYVEAGLIDSMEWMHSAVGVVSFAITSLLIIVFVKAVSGTKWLK